MYEPYYKSIEEKIEKDQKEAQNKKERMQKAFVNQLKENKEKNAKKKNKKVEEKVVHHRLESKQEKKERKQTEKTLQKTEEKAKELKKMVEELKKDLQSQKRKLYQERSEKEACINENQQLKEIIGKLKEENEEMEKQLASKSDSTYQQTIEKVKKENQRLHKENLQLKSARKDKVKKIHRLEQKVKSQKTIERMEKNKQQEQKLLSLSKELQFYKKQVEVLEEESTPAQVITQLEEHLHLETAQEYILNGKNRLWNLGTKVSKLLEQKQKEKTKEQSLKEASEKEEAKNLVGYVGKTKEGWVFFDLNYQSYTIQEVNSHKLKEGRPVSALQVSENQVMIHNYFEFEPEEMKKLRIKRKNHVTRKKVNKTDYPHFGDFEVLVVGSRSKEQYTQRLEKHGLRVTWHNPFEESYQRLAGKYRKADVVVVCTRHIPHSVMDHIDKSQEKVALMDRDNEENLAARVSYLIRQLNEQEKSEA